MLLDWHGRLFAKGAKLEKLYPMHEAIDTFFYTPGKVAKGSVHARDAMDLKRMMIAVVAALAGCIFMAMYNTGLQANGAIAAGHAPIENWRTGLMQAMGLAFDPGAFWSCLLHGALYYLPVLIVTFAVGGAWEVLFAVVRKHEVNEGFFVTGMLFPLICPPTIPLWQVAIGISFGVVIGKEVFGGTGMNFLNPALTARCFLFFAYPQNISGDLVWVAGADGYSGATLLSAAASEGMKALAAGGTPWSFWDAFWGTIPGSMGETSFAACMLGAAVLILTRVGSWRTMAGVALGTACTTLLLNALAPFVQNPFFAVPFWWHFVMGGWAFGAVYMATDPVSSSYTDAGRWIYGFGIGVMAALVRVVNPAFPEGMMLAILFMNIFASTIDYVIVKRHIKKRAARHASI